MGVGFYLPIAKVDREKRMVWGYASTATRDLDGEVIELSAIKNALPGYMEWANVREMHQPSAIGTAKEATVDEKGLYLGAKIVDDDAWKKVVDEVYKGFSIGGNVTERDGSTIKGLELIEISLVDRPANPDCRIEVFKAAGSPVLPPGSDDRDLHMTLDREEVGFLGRIIAKLAGSPLRKGGNAPGDGSKPYGNVEYADPGYRNGKKRYPIDTEEHIRAAWSYIHQGKNAAEYTAEQVASIKRRIVAAWKKKIDKDGPPEDADKAAVPDGYDEEKGVGPSTRSALEDEQGEIPAGADGFSRPAKGAEPGTTKTMRPAMMLAEAFETMRHAQRALVGEGEIEGDAHDKQMADRVGAIAKDLADLIGEKATHEGGEAVSLTDAADILSGVTGKMAEGDLGKRAASGAHEEHVRKAMEHLGEAHKCCAAGMRAMGGADEKAADGSIVKAASKARAHFERAQEHHVLAHHHMAAAAGHKGEAGEQPGDADGSIYHPEQGLTPLSLHTMTEGGAPSENDGTRPQPGKAAEGTMTKREADALIEAAFLRGKVDAMEKVPTTAKARLFAVPRGALPVGEAEEPDAMGKLLKGVNLDAVEPAHRQAAGARLIGNMIANAGTFGRPVIGDPSFRGGAGR